MNKRKVGAVIIMRPNHNNYGTSLQGLATIQVLNKLGYPFHIIRYVKNDSFMDVMKKLPGLLRSGAFPVFLKRKKQKMQLKLNSIYANNISKRNNSVNAFKNKYFEPLCDYYTGYDALKKGAFNYDVIFVGSDQVWGPLSIYSGFYNLLFVDKSIPHFSYASSFGKSRIMEWQKGETAQFLNQLNTIGVREIRGKEIVKELTGRDATVVADPTMLLTRSEWEELIASSKKTIDEPYILAYILGNNAETRQNIRKLARETNLKIVSFPHMDNYEPLDCDFGDIQVYDADCLDFVSLIKNAKYVCTDSFHCSVFSIIFHKQFLTFYRHKKTDKMSSNSRIDSLFELFGLKERLFNDTDDVLKKMQHSIEYDYVDEKLKVLNAESMDFFKNALELDNKNFYE